MVRAYAGTQKDRWIRGEGWGGYREKDGEDTGRRMDRVQGEGWREYRVKDEEDTGRMMERIRGEGWRGYMQEKDREDKGIERIHME